MSTAGLNTLPTVRAEDLLVGQYADSVNLKAYIAALMEEFNELHASSVLSISNRTIGNATGIILDTIGSLVGQARGTRTKATGAFFGFENAIGAGSFGSDGDPSVGEVFRSDADSAFITIPWTDSDYRKFILARIIKNNRAITINTLIEVILLVVDGISDVIITLTSPLVYNIHIPEVVGDNDKLLLLTSELIPVPVGCSYLLSDENGSISI
jgi:hypothetical protein